MISNMILLIGSAIRTINTHGIAPMIVPKNGITFVTPMMTLISNAYGIIRNDREHIV